MKLIPPPPPTPACRTPPGAHGAAEGDDWAGKHPWKPWDRDKDLGAAPKPRTAADLLKQTGALSSRFGSSGGR